MSGKFTWYIRRTGVTDSLWRIALAVLLLLSGCGEDKVTTGAAQKPKPHVITVKAEAKMMPLFFKAELKPKSLVNVTSHVDGEIKQIFFGYGQRVAKGQLLLSLKSKKLAEEFEQALADYWQSKEEFSISSMQWQGTEELHRLGLIARQEYELQRKQQHQKAFELYQKQKKLEQIFYETSDNSDQLIALEQLSFSAVAQVRQALQQPHDEQHLYAPAAGVVLFPEKTGKQSERSDLLENGSPVKAEDILLAIGDLSGFSLDIQVSQLQIEKLRPGQAVIVTSATFPGIKLFGKIAALDSQATKGQAGMAVFNAHVIVPEVSTEQAAHMRVGMSVQVRVDVPVAMQLWLPLTAVHGDAAKRWVMRLEQDGNAQKVPVVTGITDLDSVAIVQGLKAGDQIVIN